MSNIVLYGTGRGASVAHRFLTSDSHHNIVGFTVDSQYMTTSIYRNLPVVAFEEVEQHYPPESFRMMILLGYQDMNELRARKYQEAKVKGYTLESYVASNIFQAEPINIGENCFILDNQSISLDVAIGNNVVMWSSNHIGDMTVIRDHAWLTSHVTIAASVEIGERAFLGIGAAVSNKIKIGNKGLVGACALVTDNVPDGMVSLDGKLTIQNMSSSVFMRVMMAKGKL